MRHTITRHRVRARVEAGRTSGEALDGSLAWVARSALDGLALTGITRKVLAARFFPRTDRSPGRAPARDPARARRAG